MRDCVPLRWFESMREKQKKKTRNRSGKRGENKIQETGGCKRKTEEKNGVGIKEERQQGS